MIEILGSPVPPPRPEEGHKGTFGKVLIVGGSRGMAGAPGLAGKAALRGGAGLVAVAVPASVLAIVAGYEPSYLTIPLSEDAAGRLTAAAGEEIAAHLSGVTAVALGPGLGQSDELRLLVGGLYSSLPLPVVVDADGLNALAAHAGGCPPAPPAAPRILTPHPGEFARLMGCSTAEVQSKRMELAGEFARRTGCILVLKGPQSVITDGQRFALNSTGNHGMATGGAGDVLTGLLAALLAQRMAPFEAARLATYLHGLAGDLAVGDRSHPGLIASDLTEALCTAWRQLGE